MVQKDGSEMEFSQVNRIPVTAYSFLSLIKDESQSENTSDKDALIVKENRPLCGGSNIKVGINTNDLEIREFLTDPSHLDKELPNLMSLQQNHKVKKKKPKLSLGKIPNTVKCFCCERYVKEDHFSEHLLFGMVKCFECDQIIADCVNFGKYQTDLDLGINSCNHRLSFTNNSVDFVRERITSDCLDHTPGEEELLEEMKIFLKRIRSLEKIPPWQQAIQRCTEYLLTRPRHSLKSKNSDRGEANNESEAEVCIQKESLLSHDESLYGVETFESEVESENASSMQMKLGKRSQMVSHSKSVENMLSSSSGYRDNSELIMTQDKVVKANENLDASLSQKTSPSSSFPLKEKNDKEKRHSINRNNLHYEHINDNPSTLNLISHHKNINVTAPEMANIPENRTRPSMSQVHSPKVLHLQPPIHNVTYDQQHDLHPLPSEVADTRENRTSWSSSEVLRSSNPIHHQVPTCNDRSYQHDLHHSASLTSSTQQIISKPCTSRVPEIISSPSTSSLPDLEQNGNRASSFHTHDPGEHIQSTSRPSNVSNTGILKLKFSISKAEDHHGKKKKKHHEKHHDRKKKKHHDRKKKKHHDREKKKEKFPVDYPHRQQDLHHSRSSASNSQQVISKPSTSRLPETISDPSTSWLPYIEQNSNHASSFHLRGPGKSTPNTYMRSHMSDSGKLHSSASEARSHQGMIKTKKFPVDYPNLNPLQFVHLPNDDNYLICHKSIEECPNCYEVLNPACSTVNVNTFIITFICQGCGLYIYIINEDVKIVLKEEK